MTGFTASGLFLRPSKATNPIPYMVLVFTWLPDILILTYQASAVSLEKYHEPQYLSLFRFCHTEGFLFMELGLMSLFGLTPSWLCAFNISMIK